jgi:hypothetical protein
VPMFIRSGLFVIAWRDASKNLPLDATAMPTNPKISKAAEAVA